LIIIISGLLQTKLPDDIDSDKITTVSSWQKKATPLNHYQAELLIPGLIQNDS